MESFRRKRHHNTVDPATYITVNRGVIDANRKHRRNDPPIRVSRGKYGKVRYGHSVIVFGPSIFKYDAVRPLPHGARLWVETRAPVRVRHSVKRYVPWT